LAAAGGQTCVIDATGRAAERCSRLPSAQHVGVGAPGSTFSVNAWEGSGAANPEKIRFLADLHVLALGETARRLRPQLERAIRSVCTLAAAERRTPCERDLLGEVERRGGALGELVEGLRDLIADSPLAAFLEGSGSASRYAPLVAFDITSVPAPWSGAVAFVLAEHLTASNEPRSALVLADGGLLLEHETTRAWLDAVVRAARRRGGLIIAITERPAALGSPASAGLLAPDATQLLLGTDAADLLPLKSALRLTDAEVAMIAGFERGDAVHAYWLNGRRGRAHVVIAGAEMALDAPA
jgi:hypothetical protein